MDLITKSNTFSFSYYHQTYNNQSFPQGACVYRIYLIKRPGIYFTSKSVKGAFKRDGRLFEMWSCLLMLFLAAATALSLNLVVFLPLCWYLSLSAIIKSIYILCCHACNWFHVLVQLHPQCHAHTLEII